MKNIFILLVFFIASFSVFSQDNDPPAFMVESDVGYAVGINLNNAVFFDVKLIYPYKRFGFVVEAGGLFFPGNKIFHVFLGPLIFFMNSTKWRMPLVIGMDYISGETAYFGIGSIFSAHRRLTKYLYAGLNLEITYAFINSSEELTGYKTEKVVVDDGTGNAVFAEKTVPIYETKQHYGNNLYFKPSALIGLQF